ncbi:DUF427-domain-containing protein [Vararia minispora EC-137]|uniref:DUF427-domain-containing protein n=1 Tax=Vararia minispora EC-137 TaxID=1314806 RepID=A0ACB8QXB7_9AGAM|nr:DUF427-domain-containing protein [Vararia minispora EC-137]
MVQVIVNGQVIAESDKTVVVEGNHYFPPSDVKLDLFSRSSTSSTCPWKGVAAYYDATVDGKEIHDIAWFYPTPKDAAAQIKDHVAFYKVRRLRSPLFFSSTSRSSFPRAE